MSRFKDYIGADLRSGGGSKVSRDNAGVEIIVASDQSDDDCSVKALMNNFQQETPLVLIVDDTYRLFPYDLGEYSYAVLGYFQVVNYWGTDFPIFCPSCVDSLNSGNRECNKQHRILH